MPLQGVFNADFTSFTAACTQAEASLKAFETDARLVEGAVTRMADSLSGQKIVQQALIAQTAIEQIGGATKLTNDELIRMGGIAQQAIDKLAVMGQAIPPGLQDLADRARGVSEELLRMPAATEAAGNSFQTFLGKFDFREALEHPLATAKDGVIALTETMGPAATAALGIVGSVGAVATVLFELTEKAAGAGERIQDLSVKTGMSVPAVSMLSKAVAVAGGDMDTMANALFNLQKRMAENSPEFQKGMEKLKISSQDWKDVGVDGYMQLVAEKLKDTGDSADRAAGLVELFGRQGRDLAPVLTKLHEAEELVSDFKPWTAEQAKQADDFEMQMRSLKIHLEALATGVGKDFLGPADLFIQKVGGMAEVLLKLGDQFTGGGISQLGVAREAIRTFGAVVADVNLVLGHMPGLLDSLPAPIGRLISAVQGFSWGNLEKDALKYVAAGVDLVTGSMGTLPGVAGEATLAIEAQAKETAKLKEETKGHVMTATEQKLLELEMAPAVDAHTQALKDYAETLKAVAKVETDNRLKKEEGVLGLDKLEQESWQKRMEATVKGSDAITKASAELLDTQMKNSMDTTSYQVAKVWETAYAQIAAFKGTADQSKQYHDIIVAQATAAQAKIEDDAYGHMQGLTDKVLVDVVAVANKIKGIVDDTVAHTAQATAALQTLQGGVKMPGTSIDTAFGQQYLTGPNGVRIPLGPHGELPDNIDDLMMGRTTMASGYSNQPRIGSGYSPPSFAEGGVGDFGAGTLALLHGKEAIVPLDTDGGMGVTQHVTIHVNGTAADVARQVAAELMRTLRAGQQLTLR